VAVDRIIPICSAIALSLITSPAHARREPVSPLQIWVQARLAGTAGDDAGAAKLLAAVMTAAPDSLPIAQRSWRQAVSAGDRPLALRAAMALERLGTVGPDARILLFSEALRRGDWRSAGLQLDTIEQGEAYGFVVPTLRAWLRVASHNGDPLAALDRRTSDGFSPRFADEHRGLVLLALKRKPEAIAAVLTLGTPNDRWVPLRLAVAARLVAMKDQKAALDLLDGDDPAYRAARARINAGQSLTGMTDTPLAATAALLSRVSSDLIGTDPSPVALTLAQVSSFINQPTANTRLVHARAFKSNDRNDEALASLAQIPADDPLASRARTLRFEVLSDSGRLDEALQLATADAARPDSDWRDQLHRGEALSRLENQGEAATAYGKAIEMVAAASGPDRVPWSLWLLYGQALEQSGQWARAKPALQKAVDFGPNEASPLNYLGYSMIEAGDNLDEALNLVARASALKPDDAAITDSLGWAWFRRGDVEKALPVLEKAYAIDPTLSEIGEHLGDAYWTSGRRIDARYTWRAALLQADGKDADRIRGKLDRGLTAKVN
jgi:tetratricopeptide (TPR) repeat protein